jgi:hypothetical protein
MLVSFRQVESKGQAIANRRRINPFIGQKPPARGR